MSVSYTKHFENAWKYKWCRGNRHYRYLACCWALAVDFKNICWWHHLRGNRWRPIFSSYHLWIRLTRHCKILPKVSCADGFISTISPRRSRFHRSTSHSSNPRVGVCARDRLGGSGLRRHPCLRRGFRHHLRMRQPPQGSTGWGMEMGRLQRGCGVWDHGVPGIRWREGESTRRALGYEPP